MVNTTIEVQSALYTKERIFSYYANVNGMKIEHSLLILMTNGSLRILLISLGKHMQTGKESSNQFCQF